jgi:hypothetical protein
VNSPVEELKPTWVRCTGSYGVEISIRLEEARKLGMKPNMPFLPLVPVVPARFREEIVPALLLDPPPLLGAKEEILGGVLLPVFPYGL